MLKYLGTLLALCLSCSAQYISGYSTLSEYYPIRWDDLVISGSSVRVGGTAPSFANWNNTGIYLYSFAGSGTDDEVHIQWQLPHSWRLPKDTTNSYVVPHVHVVTTGTNTNACVWQLLYNWSNIGEVFTNIVSINVTNAMLGGIANSNVIISFGAIVKTNGTYSSILKCRLKRLAASNASDANTDAIMITSIDLHYQKDHNGSKQELSD